MKVITIKQPFATLIAEGYKAYEFRTWKTKYRGDILIHAGKGIDKAAMKKFECLNLEYPTGAILAKAKITDCVEVNGQLRSDLEKEDALVYSGIIEDTDWKGFGFKLENIKKIEPIFVNGKLGFWNYDLEGENTDE